jgi:hypothetical protein
LIFADQRGAPVQNLRKDVQEGFDGRRPTHRPVCEGAHDLLPPSHLCDLSSSIPRSGCRRFGKKHGHLPTHHL